MIDGAEFMQVAIERARQGIAAGQSPFGTAIVLDGRVVAAAHNTVWREVDPTAHAEINAIRIASKALGRIALEGCTLYSTCEPCPMCLAASHWAKVDRVVFGASIADAEAAGFRELPVGAIDLAARGRSHLVVESGLLVAECVGLFSEWTLARLGESY